MTTQAILIVVLVAAVLAIIIGSKFNINMGLLALIFAAIIGGFILGIKPRVLYTYWPAGIVLQIIGVTFFYGFVNESGAIRALTDRIMYRVQNAFWLMPIVIYALSAALGYIGVNPMGINALMLPIVASICLHTNRSPFALFMLYGAGSMAGLLSPLGSAGIVASGMMSAIIGDAAGTIAPRMYINNFIFSLVVFVIWFVIFRGWGMKVDEEHKEFLKNKPEPMTRAQKQVLTIMFVTIALFVICGVFNIPVLNSALDVGWVYMLAGAVCLVLKIADQRTVITRHIPWSIILLVGGFTILLTIMTSNGCADMIAGVITQNVSAKAISPLMALLAGITSVFSDSIGVVLPLYIPVCAGTLSFGVSAATVFSSAIIGALSTGCAPFSTGGAMVMSFAPDSMKKKMFWMLLLAAAVDLVVVVGMSALGLFG